MRKYPSKCLQTCQYKCLLSVIILYIKFPQPHANSIKGYVRNNKILSDLYEILLLNLQSTFKNKLTSWCRIDERLLQITC